MSIIRLKEILENKGMQGKDLAGIVKLSPTAISNIAQGKAMPKPENLLKIAKALDVDLRELFISTKNKEGIVSEPLYIKKGNEYLPVGNLNVHQITEKQNPQP